MLRTTLVATSIAAIRAQQAGTAKVEGGPTMTLQECTLNFGCVESELQVVLDANWRWLHDAKGWKNCYTGTEWDSALCPDPLTCAQSCAVEGVTTEQYKSVYGISAIPGGLQLNFVTKGSTGEGNVGSRVYLKADESSYKMFQLKNREFTMDVDVSKLPCGINGAVYFVEMDAHGGGAESNKAGAKFGTGYCDAQCPHDVKFIEGEANIINWNSTTAQGGHGHCCAEMDIWEANSRSAAYTPHPCALDGPLKCEGLDCGDNEHRYEGVCDKDGCDFNSFRMGDQSFYGAGPDFKVDTTRPFTLVTQFITHDGTDTGDLVEIKRIYWQDGRGVVANSKAVLLGDDAPNSVTDDFCAAQKSLFGDTDDFSAKGGNKQMGEALGRGMVLVLSLWDDSAVNMLWLDSNYPADRPHSDLGVARGPCPGGEASKPAYLRSTFPDAYVRFQHLAVGGIGSTIELRRRLSQSEQLV